MDNAIVDYTEAIKHKPDEAETYNNRGVSYLKKGELDNAIKDCDKAIQLQPDSVKTYNNRGEAWLHLQKWEKAKVNLTRAKALGVDIVNLFYDFYDNLENCEKRIGARLPRNITAMLGKQ